MHELSVAHSIVEACSERAGDTPVTRVTVEIGTLSCVMAESLRFCFYIAAADTPLAAATLEIIRVAATSRCRECGRRLEMQDILAACVCGSVNLEPPTGGERLTIKSMVLATPETEYESERRS